jgi:3-methyladenine DNA glycosylase/8-oxoguanine DNA glycosylase
MSSRLQFSLDCPEHYDLHATCHAHGWKYLAPFRWDKLKATLYVAALLKKDAADIEISQRGKKLSVEIVSHKKLSASDRTLLVKNLRRSLDIDRPTGELLALCDKHGKPYGKLVRGGAGRLLRSLTLWEDAAKTLFTTNCTWALTLKMAEGVCSEKFSTPTPSGYFPFPEPQAILKKSSDQLRKLLPVGYRAPYFHALAIEFSNNPTLNDIETSVDPALALEAAHELHGFGPYAASHLLIMAGHFNYVPVDTWVSGFVRQAFGAKDAKSFCLKRYNRWDRYAWWGLRLDQMLKEKNFLGE